MASSLRKSARLLRRIALGPLALLLIYGLLALLLPRIPVGPDASSPPTEGVTVWVESNGVHTDFVVPTRSATIDWEERFPIEWFPELARPCDFVAIGWGDRGFYLETPDWSDLRFSVAFKAAFFLGSAAAHVEWIPYEPEPGEGCRKLVLTEAQYRRLVDYLLATFQRDEAGRFRHIDHRGYNTRDAFFEANGTYSLIRTCNEWTGAGLDAIDVRTGAWTPFAGDVLRWLPK